MMQTPAAVASSWPSGRPSASVAAHDVRHLAERGKAGAESAALSRPRHVNLVIAAVRALAAGPYPDASSQLGESRHRRLRLGDLRVHSRRRRRSAHGAGHLVSQLHQPADAKLAASAVPRPHRARPVRSICLLPADRLNWSIQAESAARRDRVGRPSDWAQSGLDTKGSEVGGRRRNLVRCLSTRIL